MSRHQPNRRSSYQKTHITRHGRGWKYARAIPADLRTLEGGKTTYVKTLGAVAYEDAEREARRFDAIYDTRIQRLRALSDAARQEILSVEHLPGWSPVDAFLSSVKQDANCEYIEDGAHRLALEILESPDERLSDEDQAQQLLEFHRIKEEYQGRLIERRRRKYLAGDISGTQEHRLKGLIALWEAVKKPRSSKTIEKAHLYVQRFVDICGDLEPALVSRTHATKFMQSLQQKKYSPGTINLHLEKLHALFNVGISEQKFGIKQNPFAHIRVQRGNDLLVARKRPFTSQQIVMILENCDTGSEFELITRILAFHGCRSSEVCQLTTEDVQQLHGIWVMQIHAGNGSLKNASAIRELPIHAKCRTALFAQRRRVLQATANEQALAPDGCPWLFPRTVCRRPGAVRGHDFQLEFGRLLRKIGIVDRALSQHSLRHSFRDLCREAEMPEDISRAIMGHSLGRGDHGATYGVGVSLGKRSEWLNKINPTTSSRSKKYARSS